MAPWLPDGVATPAPGVLSAPTPARVPVVALLFCGDGPVLPDAVDLSWGALEVLPDAASVLPRSVPASLLLSA
ncbi:MAG: hypothetical protein Q4E06_09675 [Lautropia sp.]|nr:hypothetical protein [Lautropia sp.]